MKYFLYIIIFLIASWFLPIIPQVHKKMVNFFQCSSIPCDGAWQEKTIINFITLKEIIN